jgi:hypothetical protein
MPAGEDDRELTGGAAHVAQRRVPREIDLLRQRLKRPRGEPGHRVHELLQAALVAMGMILHDWNLAGKKQLVKAAGFREADVLPLAGPTSAGIGYK